MTVALLAQISQQLQDTANTSVPAPSPDQVRFSKPRTAIALNVCWFMSLALSVTCAFGATLVMQWARDYQQAIKRYAQAAEKAAMRVFVYDGLQRWQVRVVVQCLPAILHASFGLFFSGLVIFLWSIDMVVTVFVTMAIAASCSAYAFLTLGPLIRAEMPYWTPLTGIIAAVIGAVRLGYVLVIRPPMKTPLASIPTILMRREEAAFSYQHSDLAPDKINRFRDHGAMSPAMNAQLVRQARALVWTFLRLPHRSELQVRFLHGLHKAVLVRAASSPAALVVREFLQSPARDALLYHLSNFPQVPMLEITYAAIIHCAFAHPWTTAPAGTLPFCHLHDILPDGYDDSPAPRALMRCIRALADFIMVWSASLAHEDPRRRAIGHPSLSAAFQDYHSAWFTRYDLQNSPWSRQISELHLILQQPGDDSDTRRILLQLRSWTIPWLPSWILRYDRDLARQEAELHINVNKWLALNMPDDRLQRLRAQMSTLVASAVKVIDLHRPEHIRWVIFCGLMRTTLEPWFPRSDIVVREYFIRTMNFLVYPRAAEVLIHAGMDPEHPWRKSNVAEPLHFAPREIHSRISDLLCDLLDAYTDDRMRERAHEVPSPPRRYDIRPLLRPCTLERETCSWRFPGIFERVTCTDDVFARLVRFGALDDVELAIRSATNWGFVASVAVQLPDLSAAQKAQDIGISPDRADCDASGSAI